MAGRLINMTAATVVVQRPDRSLLIYFGRGPDSVKDDDTFFTQWAWDPWPTRSGSVFDGADAGNWPLSNRHVYIEDIRWSGCSNPLYRITGYCYDDVGNPVSGVTCRLVRTIDQVEIARTLSKEDGEYSFGMPDNTTQHGVDAYRESPMVSGGTVRTLVGS